MRIYNLGVACGTPGDATNFYRAIGPLGPLRAITSGLTFTLLKEIQWAFLKTIDGVFMHRPYNNDHLTLCRMVKNNRKPLWIDHDDNLFEVGIDNPVFQEYAGGRVKENIAEMVGMADIVTVTTPYLGQIYSRFTKVQPVVIPNALDDDLINIDEAPKETKPTVFWRGSNSHVKDWASVASGFLGVAAKHPEFKYGFMGYQPWNIIEPLAHSLSPDHIISIGGCDIMRYFAIIRELAPKFMVVPLQPGSFNYAKSNIAWLEGMYAGAVVVAPGWPEWARPGVRSYNAPEGQDLNPFFADTLEKTLSMPEDERSKVRDQGWNFVKANLLLSKVNYSRRAILEKYMGL